MENNPLEMGQRGGPSSVDGFSAWGKSRDSACGGLGGLSREVDGKNGDLEAKIGGFGGGGGSGLERGMKNFGFSRFASSIDGFRVLREKDSAHVDCKGVNIGIDVKRGDLEGKIGSVRCDTGMHNDVFDTGVKVDEGQENPNSVQMGGETEKEAAEVAEMDCGNILPESLMNRMGETEEKVVIDRANNIGVLDGVGNRENIDLVDSNGRHGPSEKQLSGNGIGNKETEIEGLNASNVPFYDGVVNDVIPFREGVGLHENQDAVIKEQMGYVDLEDKDGSDLEVVPLRPNVRGEECATEKEGEYYLMDLVWAKVWGHPWWPGQIFEPSAASEKARKYFKKDSYLIAYFGDRSFAWNEAARIKPFRMHCTQMERQSNSDGFRNAVNCALDEVSRRVEIGLSCLCLPEEQLAKIATQTVVNAGIRGEASTQYGGDYMSSASTFLPAELLQELKSFAMAPNRLISRLRFVTARAKVMAFNRWKGFYELPELIELGGFLEKDADMMSGTITVSENGEKKAKGKRGRKKGSTNKKHEASESISEDSNLKRRKRILSPEMHKESSSLNPVFGVLMPSSGKFQRKILSPVNIQPEKMLSSVSLAASGPMEFYNSIFPFISFFSDFRNSVCLENKNARRCKRSLEEHKGELSETGTVETFGFDGMEDSYWTDRIIQSNYGQKVLFRPESLEGSTAPLVEPTTADKASPDLNGEERDAVVPESEAEDPAVSVDENSEEYTPTALSLKFSDMESVPSVADLNRIFGRYGPLNESQTKVFGNTKRAKVIFDRRADAETAFSSAGKYSIFGPSLLCYRLKPLPVKAATIPKRKRKGATSK